LFLAVLWCATPVTLILPPLGVSQYPVHPQRLSLFPHVSQLVFYFPHVSPVAAICFASCACSSVFFFVSPLLAQYPLETFSLQGFNPFATMTPSNPSQELPHPPLGLFSNLPSDTPPADFVAALSPCQPLRPRPHSCVALRSYFSPYVTDTPSRSFFLFGRQHVLGVFFFPEKTVPLSQPSCLGFGGRTSRVTSPEKPLFRLSSFLVACFQNADLPSRN